MPRPRGSKESFFDNRDNDRPSPRPNRRNTGAEILALRDQEHTFASIAGAVGLKRSSDAHAGFVRAVRELPEDQRTEVLQREAQRLDRLEQRIRTRDGADPTKMARRLEALQAMRDVLR